MFHGWLRKLVNRIGWSHIKHLPGFSSIGNLYISGGQVAGLTLCERFIYWLTYIFGVEPSLCCSPVRFVNETVVSDHIVHKPLDLLTFGNHT